MLLLDVLIFILVLTLPEVIDSDWHNLIGVVLFVTAMMVIGHFLGGRDPETRISIVLANSSRRAGLALALVTVHIKDSHPVLGIIVAIALLATLVGAIYTKLYRKRWLNRTQTTVAQ